LDCKGSFRARACVSISSVNSCMIKSYTAMVLVSMSISFMCIPLCLSDRLELFSESVNVWRRMLVRHSCSFSAASLGWSYRFGVVLAMSWGVSVTVGASLGSVSACSCRCDVLIKGGCAPSRYWEFWCPPVSRSGVVTGACVISDKWGLTSRWWALSWSVASASSVSEIWNLFVAEQHSGSLSELEAIILSCS
jgi:hypothetical protein